MSKNYFDSFNTPIEASNVYRKEKYKYILHVADRYKKDNHFNERVYDSLINNFAVKFKD